MKKLIKLSDIHYIVVDDSEITGFENNIWVYNNSRVWLWKNTMALISNNKPKKITHSTQPLEEMNHGNYKSKVFLDIKPLSLSEVEELIYGYSVEKMARNWLKGKGLKESSIAYTPFIEGFNAHKELVKDKLFTVEDMENCIKHILRCLNTHNETDKPVNFVWNDYFKHYIQSLLPKTEWECCISDGKLILLQ
jgi:hypothetical protein